MAGEWTEKRKMLITAVVGAVVNLVLAYFLYAANQTLAVENAKLTALKTREATLGQVVRNLQSSRNTLETLKLQFETQQSRLPSEQDLNKLITSISKLATEKHVERKSIQFGPEEPANSYVRNTWHTTWEASFFDWCSFMNVLEENLGSFDRFVSFENLSMTIKNNGMIPTGTKHSFAVDIVTYRYKP